MYTIYILSICSRHLHVSCIMYHMHIKFIKKIEIEVIMHLVIWLLYNSEDDDITLAAYQLSTPMN